MNSGPLPTLLKDTAIVSRYEKELVTGFCIIERFMVKSLGWEVVSVY